MSYLDAGGRYQGVDPDIARAVAQAMGVEAEFATVGFDAFIPSVQQDRCDIYMAGVTVTRERATQVHFTEYLDVGTQLLVPWGNPKGITTLDGASGKSMGVVVGSVGKQIFDRLNKELAAAGKPEVTIRVFNNGTAAAQALLAGQIDGFAQDSVGMVALLKQYPQRVELGLPAPVNKLPLGIVSNRNRADLNSALAAAVCRLYTDKTIPRTLTRAGLANAAYSGACR
jgi:polar amino acid transport system substrate-binding protein